MFSSKLRLHLALVVTLTLALYAVAETGTPYPAGTNVEVVTPAGTVSGSLQDRTTPGWVLVLEPNRKAPTAVPEKSIAFIRSGATLPAAVAESVLLASSAAVVSLADTSDHLLHGQPRVAKPERFAFQPFPGGPLVPGVSVLKRHAFTLGHYDRHKTPAWVAMRWTKANLDISEGEPSHPRNFEADTDLPEYARTGKDYQHAQFGYQRGHMARHEDLSGFPAPGDKRRGTREGCLMSNIVPQQQQGHTVWGKLEDEHRQIVGNASAGIKTIWLIAGPVFKNGQAKEVIGPARVGTPHAVYKIIAWQKPGGKPTARGYVIRQEDTNTDLKGYLTAINGIEAETGLDFFPSLDDVEEEELESKKFSTLWGED